MATFNWVAYDSGESAEVQAICAAVHTAEVIAAFEASQGDAP